jgi:hypothetical protein
MKKFLKALFITIASFMVILTAAICIVLWYVFTPEKLTPIVHNQVHKFINCQTEVGEVELTFFSTFPSFGLKVNNLALINPMADAPCDTLLVVERLIGEVDAAAWWKNNELILTDFVLTNGTIRAYTDSLGNSNFNILIPDTTSSAAGSETMFGLIDARNIGLKNINVSYFDNSSGLKTDIRNLIAEISGTINPDSISGNVKVSRSEISFEYKGEKYLDNASVRLDFPTDIVLSRQFVRIKEASALMNDLGITLNGTIATDTSNKNIIADISYKLKSWKLKEVLDLIPASFGSYLEGIDADGLLTSEGNIKGIFNDSLMPVMDIHVLLEKGTLKHAGFPLPFKDIYGDIAIYSDLKTDSLSYIRINSIKVKTPKSEFESKGMVNHLFSDIHCNLTTDADLSLTEFNPVIPDDMKIAMRGNVRGRLKSVFSMSQIENMQFERMKHTGSFTLSNLDVSYDSLSLKTDLSEIEFSLPNRNATTKDTRFAFIKIDSKNLFISKLEGYLASLEGVHIAFETSDVRDTTMLPNVVFSFNIDSLAASMDTMRIAASKPHGKISFSPGNDNLNQPMIKLAYNSEKLETTFGRNSAIIEKLVLDTDILNEKAQEDIFLQWLVKGFIDMEQGTIALSALSHTLEIPAIKMDFEPEKFIVKESSMKIGQSDFQLAGHLDNMLSYFRNDSILRGNFSFVSGNTDILQLMNLTNGVGNDETQIVNRPEDANENLSFTGPYMVPKGVDIRLNTNVQNASFGIDTVTRIIGEVRINDGVLLLDEITFETSAAKMQLTAMYHTPRKNHLFLGLDYHMFDVEIDQLLKMIPDIDTLMPMLRSFGGRGEFHLAVETYLDSLYNIKKSTLRGASSIKGQDLVLMDGETFSEIAKKLRFNKKTANRVDSLSAEFTIFREEIDIYPFLIVMDKYKAVIAGRHNFDLSFDYHISVVDCPLPIKLGIDVKGTMDNFSYNMTKCKYAEFYRPAWRRVVENKQLELRKMIRDALTQRVKG